jgi:adenine/guanine phosphoribosyltransferase-like PRPP-binding protein
VTTRYLETMTNPAALAAAGKWVAGLAKRLGAERLLVVGTSGLSVGAVASALSGVPLVVLRKPQEPCHGFGSIEPGLGRPEIRRAGSPSRQLRVLLVDDFVGRGETLANMLQRAQADGYKTFLGCALYAAKDSNPAGRMQVYYYARGIRGEGLPAGFVFYENLFV